MPSFTFVSTANAFVLRGATPVFVDIRARHAEPRRDAVADAITPATQAIVPVHYAGVGCDMDAITRARGAARLIVIEDAAQGVGATWQGRALGALGAIGALSFHETKNVSCGEGGALLVNDARFVERAEILRRRAPTARASSAARSTSTRWVDIGSSYLPERHQRRALLGPARAGGRITAARRALGALPRGVRGARGRRACCAGRFRRAASTTRTCTTSCSPTARSATSSSARWASAASGGLPLRPAARSPAGGARPRAWRAAVTDAGGTPGPAAALDGHDRRGPRTGRRRGGVGAALTRRRLRTFRSCAACGRS